MFLPVMVAAAVATASGSYEFGPGSEIDYYVVHPMHHVKGVTHNLKGKVGVEKDHLVTPLTLEVPLITFRSGNANRDENAANVLGISANPLARLVVTRFTETGRSVRGNATHITGKAAGKLTLHGVTQAIELPIDATLEPGSLVVDSAFSVLLTTYRMERPALLFKPIEDEVKVTVHGVAASR